MVTKWMVGLVSMLIIILDQFTKWLAREIIIEPITLTSFLSFTTIHNTGIAFGLFQGYGWIFTFVSIVIIVGLIYYYPKISEAWFPKLSYTFIISGAIGNLVDRIVFGTVTDFISFSFWPAFNVADTAITLGVIGLLIHYYTERTN